MAKRYHQSRKDRRNEREGAYHSMAEKNYRKADYDWARMKDSEGRYHEEHRRLDQRRRSDMEDSYMIKEDHNAIANLPQRSKMAMYPSNPYNPSHLNDTIKGVDNQIDDDHSEMMKHRKPEKY